MMAAPTAAPAVITSERDLLDQVLELSVLLGWEAAHFRPALTQRGWRTPVQGSLGKGFPDLVLVRARDRRLVLAELKSDTGRLTPEQERVHAVLGDLVVDQVALAASLASPLAVPRIGVYVWRPRDWSAIVEVLR